MALKSLRWVDGEMPALIKANQLVGLDVKGLKAIVTQPECRHQYEREGGVPVVTLESVAYERHEGRQWLYVRWDKRQHPQPFACGYSGWREDHKGSPVIELL